MPDEDDFLPRKGDIIGQREADGSMSVHEMEEDHPPDCGFCMAGEPMVHTYQSVNEMLELTGNDPIPEPPGTMRVHRYDGEPCEQSDQDHGLMVCIHGCVLIEVYTGQDSTPG